MSSEQLEAERRPMTLLELRDAIAKAIADSVDLGMREKCERQADAVMAVVGPQLVLAADHAGHEFPECTGDPKDCPENEGFGCCNRQAARSQPAEGTILVAQEDGNNYCLILTALGMEEEGDPVAEVKRLIELSERPNIDPTVTACGVFYLLISIMGSDNGTWFDYTSEDRLKAVPAIIDMLNAGYFTGDPEALEGDFWQMAAGEETEKAEYFGRSAVAFSIVDGVLNEIFDRPPASPAQPSVPVEQETTGRVFVCSNKACGAVFRSDPQGHCPICIDANGGGWSTMRKDVIVRDKGWLIEPSPPSVPVEALQKLIDDLKSPFTHHPYGDFVAELRKLIDAHDGKGNG
jgi:hypothetical protein